MLPEDRERIWHITQQAIAAGRAYEYEYRIRNKDQQLVWVWERGQLSETFVHADGLILEGIINNISARKLMEQELADAVAFSNAILESAAEAVITIDTGGNIETFNPAAQEMFGYSLQDIRNKNVNILMPEPYHSQHDRYLDSYLATNNPKIIGIGREVRAQRADGSVFPIHLSVSEVTIHQHRKFVGLIRDMTAQREAESNARHQLEQLAHMDRLNMLGEMAAGIAHEINQPLTAISLFSQVGKRLYDAGNADKLTEIFDKLSEHAERAGTIIERMQTMARPGESSREIIHCNALLEDIARLAEAEARIRDIEVRLVLSPDVSLVDVDVVQIQQVALNLLRNGMQAMTSVGCVNGNKIILKTLLRDDGDIEIDVIDSGCGVSEAVAETIFTPFSSTKESGMGMGLCLSKTLVVSHGGQLGYRNNKKAGATFYFTLPTAS